MIGLLHKSAQNISKYTKKLSRVCFRGVHKFVQFSQFGPISNFSPFFRKIFRKKVKNRPKYANFDQKSLKKHCFLWFFNFLKTSLKFWKKSSYRGAHKVGDRVKICQKFFRIFEKVKKNIGSKYFCKLPLIWFNYRGNKID